MKPSQLDLTAARLRQRLLYDRDTGVFKWRDGPKEGRIAGRVHVGYRCIKIDSVEYFAHRLAWLHEHGEWPKEYIDHIDGDKLNNAAANLREASAAQNAQNLARQRRHTKSGLLGATWHAKLGKWQASIRHEGKLHYLGLKDTADAAHALYLSAKKQMHTFNPVPR